MLDDILGTVVVGMAEHVGEDGIGFVERREVETFLGALHRLQQLGVGNIVIAVEGDAVNLDFLSFVDMEIEVDGLAHLVIGAFFHHHVAVVEALVDIIVLDEVDAGGLEVVVDDVALRDLEFLAEVGLLVFLCAHEGKGEHAGAGFQVDVEEGGVADRLGDGNTDVFVKTCAPKFFDGLGDFLAGNFNLIAHLEEEHSLVKVARSGGGDATDFKGGGIGDGVIGSEHNLRLTDDAE